MNPLTLLQAGALICAVLGQDSQDCHITQEPATTRATRLANNANGQIGGITTYYADGKDDWIALDGDHPAPAATVAATWEHEITHLKGGRAPTFAFKREWCLQSERDAYAAQIAMFRAVTLKYGNVPAQDAQPGQFDWTGTMTAAIKSDDHYFVDYWAGLVKAHPGQCTGAWL